MAVAVFDYATWQARYPELAGSVAEPLAASYFTEATLYLDNTDASVVSDVGQRLLFLNMIVSHIADLNAPINGQAPSGLVGRVTGATEGTVSVSVDAGDLSALAAWFSQTRYGAAFWAATGRFRQARYVPARPYAQEPFAFGRRRPWG